MFEFVASTDSRSVEPHLGAPMIMILPVPSVDSPSATCLAVAMILHVRVK